jgi:hypothetical protein
MFARWYLIIFILSLLFFLFVAGYNLYENYKVRKNCSVTCEENQNILLVLNIIVILLIFVLIIGFFFAREKSSPLTVQKGAQNGGQIGSQNGVGQQKGPIVQQGPIVNGQPMPVQFYPQQKGILQGPFQGNQQLPVLVNQQAPAQGFVQVQQPPINMKYNNNSDKWGGNPFGYIDIIPKI